MPTGDGLLVRLLALGTIPLEAFNTLCAAARAYGNGVVEITARGSIQVRGLTATSAQRFADTIATLAIAAEGIPILTNPLTGIDPAEIFDAGALAHDLRNKLAASLLPERLAPKISIAIDDGGALDLGAISADVRLDPGTENDGRSLRIGLGGDRDGAIQLGIVAIANAAEAVVRLLEVVAGRGRSARTRDIVKAEGTTLFRTATADLMTADKPPASCPGLSRASTSSGRAEQKDVDGRVKPGHDAPREAIGLHLLRDASFASGVALAFGHADASALEHLTEAARSAGAVGMRTAPGRVLLAIGISPANVATFIAAAARLGFIISPDDPRRRVIACTGAPGCASAYMPARAIAPEIAETAASSLTHGETLHISGCAKGCAHPAPAAFTIVGTPEGCALVANGTTRDTPFAIVGANRLSEAIASAMREGRHV
jgi:precorrin-3B synthase